MKEKTMKSISMEILKLIGDDPDNIDILNDELERYLGFQLAEITEGLDGYRIMNIISDMEDILYSIDNTLSRDIDIDPDSYNFMINNLRTIEAMDDDEFVEYNTAFELLIGVDIACFLSAVRSEINIIESANINNTVFNKAFLIIFKEEFGTVTSDPYDVAYTDMYVNIDTVPDNIYHYYIKNQEDGSYRLFSVDGDIDKYEEDYVDTIINKEGITICSKREIPKDSIVYLAPFSDGSRTVYNPLTGTFEDVPKAES